MHEPIVHLQNQGWPGEVGVQAAVHSDPHTGDVGGHPPYHQGHGVPQVGAGPTRGQAACLEDVVNARSAQLTL